MKTPKFIAAAAIATALATASLTGPATAAIPDGATSIKVELGGPEDPAADHRVFEVKNIVPGAGVELTEKNETSNTSDWCGDLPVDIDPTTRRIVLGKSAEVCNFALVRVTITAKYLSGIKVTADSLFGSEAAKFKRSVVQKGNTVTIQWVNPSDDWYNTSGTATLTWAPFSIARTPKISGTAKAGRTLKVRSISASTFTPTASKVTYAWYRSGKKIGGAHKSSYKLKKADKGKKIRAKVTASGFGLKPFTVSTKSVRVKK